MNDIFVDISAVVSDSAILGKGSKVWGLAHVREKATIGANCIIGRGAYIGAGVELGENCKVQNTALVYEPAVIENGVFIGPGAILTNDQFPRAVTTEGELKHADDWVPVGVIVREGASIGAGAICVAPVTIGEWALVGAGSTVTRDVAPHSIVVGSPARHVGWVGRAGKPLRETSGTYVCPETGEAYREVDGQLSLVGAS
jgi:UDP-2-acetamido-3-amino-2,3-dideoxy-glucuronate N-acetyltransferase